MRQNTLLAFGHVGGRLRNAGRDVLGNDQDAVFIRVDQIAWTDENAPHLDRAPEVDQMNVGMRNTNAPGKIMESE